MSRKRHALGKGSRIRDNLQQPIDTQGYTVAFGQAFRQRLK